MSDSRDFVMARLAAARQHATSTLEAIDGCLSLFVFPAEDKQGKDRAEALDIASESAGDTSRSIELAQALFEDFNKEELAEEEPESDDGDDGDDEEGGRDPSGAEG